MKLPVKRHEVIQPLDKPYRFIPLTQGQNAIVDAADYDWLDQWNWCAVWDPNPRTFYAYRRKQGGKISMHRAILWCAGEEEADHRDGNGLNNRRYNLRKCTHAQNARNGQRRHDNTSGYKGVSWHKPASKWMAQIQTGGRKVYLGCFPSKKGAAHAYDEAAKLFHGYFAHLNFP